MGRTIAIASGKGGVGKTTLTTNLGLALAKTGKKVIMVDADLDMANLELAFGMEGRPITLQDIIQGEINIQDAMYEIEKNAWFVPAGISQTQSKRIDPDKLANVIEQLSERADFVILDCPAGIGRDTIACFSACKETLIIITPEPMSATDGFKTAGTASKMGSEVIGVILNMIKKTKGELSERDITSLLNVPILARIVQDKEIETSIIQGKPLINTNPGNESIQEIKKLAANLTGTAFKKQVKKKGFLSGLFGIFKKR